MTRLYLVRTEPVEQVAAHPDTMPLLVQALESAQSQILPASPTARMPSLFDLPLVPDDTVPRDVISLRPHPHRDFAPLPEPTSW
ncbi:hypothetical protein [Streptomyces sp. NPDC005760]|uniref:hypothetical protein n=1 Tax=Streptomyces sp. NPDC005760 TaxID=3156718 RepID=UPI0033D38430